MDDNFINLVLDTLRNQLRERKIQYTKNYEAALTNLVSYRQTIYLRDGPHTLSTTFLASRLDIDIRFTFQNRGRTYTLTSFVAAYAAWCYYVILLDPLEHVQFLFDLEKKNISSTDQIIEQYQHDATQKMHKLMQKLFNSLDADPDPTNDKDDNLRLQIITKRRMDKILEDPESLGELVELIENNNKYIPTLDQSQQIYTDLMSSINDIKRLREYQKSQQFIESSDMNELELFYNSKRSLKHQRLVISMQHLINDLVSVFIQRDILTQPLRKPMRYVKQPHFHARFNADSNTNPLTLYDSDSDSDSDSSYSKSSIDSDYSQPATFDPYVNAYEKMTGQIAIGLTARVFIEAYPITITLTFIIGEYESRDNFHFDKDGTLVFDNIQNSTLSPDIYMLITQYDLLNGEIFRRDEFNRIMDDLKDDSVNEQTFRELTADPHWNIIMSKDGNKYIFPPLARFIVAKMYNAEGEITPTSPHDKIRSILSNAFLDVLITLFPQVAADEHAQLLTLPKKTDNQSPDKTDHVKNTMTPPTIPSTHLHNDNDQVPDQVHKQIHDQNPHVSNTHPTNENSDVDSDAEFDVDVDEHTDHPPEHWFDDFDFENLEESLRRLRQRYDDYSHQHDNDTYSEYSEYDENAEYDLDPPHDPDFDDFDMDNLELSLRRLAHRKQHQDEETHSKHDDTSPAEPEYYDNTVYDEDAEYDLDHEWDFYMDENNWVESLNRVRILYGDPYIKPSLESDIETYKVEHHIRQKITSLFDVSVDYVTILAAILNIPQSKHDEIYSTLTSPEIQNQQMFAQRTCLEYMIRHPRSLSFHCVISTKEKPDNIILPPYREIIKRIRDMTPQRMIRITNINKTVLPARFYTYLTQYTNYSRHYPNTIDMDRDVLVHSANVNSEQHHLFSDDLGHESMSPSKIKINNIPNTWYEHTPRALLNSMIMVFSTTGPHSIYTVLSNMSAIPRPTNIESRINAVAFHKKTIQHPSITETPRTLQQIGHHANIDVIIPMFYENGNSRTFAEISLDSVHKSMTDERSIEKFIHTNAKHNIIYTLAFIAGENTINKTIKPVSAEQISEMYDLDINKKDLQKIIECAHNQLIKQYAEFANYSTSAKHGNDIIMIKNQELTKYITLQMELCAIRGVSQTKNILQRLQPSGGFSNKKEQKYVLGIVKSIQRRVITPSKEQKIKNILNEENWIEEFDEFISNIETN